MAAAMSAAEPPAQDRALTGSTLTPLTTPGNSEFDEAMTPAIAVPCQEEGLELDQSPGSSGLLSQPDCPNFSTSI